MVKVIQIEVNECTCEGCGARWVPRPVWKEDQGKWVTELPIPCTVCKSAYWDRPRNEQTSNAVQETESKMSPKLPMQRYSSGLGPIVC